MFQFLQRDKIDRCDWILVVQDWINGRAYANTEMGRPFHTKVGNFLPC